MSASALLQHSLAAVRLGAGGPHGMGAAAAAGRRALGFGCNGRVVAAVGARRAFRCSAAARMTEETNDALEDMAEQNAKSQRLAQQASDNTTRGNQYTFYFTIACRGPPPPAFPTFVMFSSLRLRPFRCNARDVSESVCVGAPAPSVRWPIGCQRRRYLRSRARSRNSKIYDTSLTRRRIFASLRRCGWCSGTPGTSRARRSSCASSSKPWTLSSRRGRNTSSHSASTGCVSSLKSLTLSQLVSHPNLLP